MVKRSLLAAQKGDGSCRIAGLRTVTVPRNSAQTQNEQATSATTVEQNVTAATCAKNGKRKRAKKQSKNPNASTDCVKKLTRPKSDLIESIYGAQQAAKKRRIMEQKTLDKVTSVREAFEVCLFKAERSEGENLRDEQHLQHLLSHLATLKMRKARLNEIARTEEQIRKVRAKITTERASKQTPIDVLVNVAKFSLQNCTKSCRQEKTSAPATGNAAVSKSEEPSKCAGTVVTAILLPEARQFLCDYAQQLLHVKSEKPARAALPPLRFNWRDSYAFQCASALVGDDSLFHLHWSLSKEDYDKAKVLHNRAQVNALDSVHQSSALLEDASDSDDEDDLIDDTARDEWLANNRVCLHSEKQRPLTYRKMRAILQAEDASGLMEHALSRTHREFALANGNLAKKAAEHVADRVISLFFKDEKKGDTSFSTDSDAKQARRAESSTGDSSANAKDTHKELAVVRIGQLQKSAAIGGKSRNRVRNKMKPARNTENVSIMNFLNVKAQAMSAKHVTAAKFIDFMQRRERQLGNEEHNGDTIFSTFASERERESQATQSRHRQQLDKGNDCHNAGEHLPLPRYDNPVCPRCQSPVHVSSRTGMETCTSPNCGYAVYMATGFDVVHLEQQVHNSYQYLLVVHMKSTLRRVQGKESAMVPHRIKDAVRERLLMERADLRKVTPKKVKKVLKDLNLQAWYNHRHKICTAITGRKPYQFTPEEEDVILAVFERLIEPYNLFRPKNDENFPYYRYALHKILQLLGYPDYVLREFPILKARKNHRRKEAIWEKMMHYRGWDYFES